MSLAGYMHGDLAGDLAGSLAGDGGVTIDSILGALLQEQWVSTLGIALASGNVDTWTGQKAGTVWQAPAVGQRPGYTANAAFKGITTVDCAVTGAKCLINTTYALAALGTRPYFLYVMQDRDGAGHAGVDYKHFGLSNAGAVFRRQAYTNTNSTFRAATTGFASVLDRTPLDAVSHMLEFWNDASTGASYAEDGATVTNAADTAALVDACTQLELGAVGGSQQGNLSFALFLQCSSVPSGAQRAQLRAYCQSVYGTP